LVLHTCLVLVVGAVAGHACASTARPACTDEGRFVGVHFALFAVWVHAPVSALHFIGNVMALSFIEAEEYFLASSGFDVDVAQDARAIGAACAEREFVVIDYV
jgi:hypothetical protein